MVPLLTSVVLTVAIAFATATFPPFTGPVVDAADVVPAVVEQRVDAALLDYQQRSGIQIAMAVVETTAPETPNAYAADLARNWGVIANGLQRGVVVVIASKDRTAGIAVSPGVAATFTPDLQRRFLATQVVPRVKEADESDAIELGAIELRRALGDSGLPAPVAPAPVPKPVHHRQVPWAAIVFAFVAVVLVVASRVLVRRRRDWSVTAPVLWGTGWGRHVGGFPAVLDRRYRRVREAVHVAEAETGLRLCFWLGPVEGEAGPRADDLFAHAVIEGHAAALLLVSTSTAAVELRVAEWAATRVPADVAHGIADAPSDDALITAAGRIATAAGAHAPAAGGVANPDLYKF